MEKVYVLELVEYDDYAFTSETSEVLLGAVYSHKELAEAMAKVTCDIINRREWQMQKDKYPGLADYRPTYSYGCDGRKVFVREVPVVSEFPLTVNS